MKKFKIVILDQNGKKIKVTIKGDFDEADVESDKDWAQAGDVYVQAEGTGKIISTKLIEIVQK